MNRKETLERITAVNEELLKKGYSFTGIKKFWNECFKEAKNKMNATKLICPGCKNEENFHENRDYSKKDQPVTEIICNECGKIIK